MSYCLREPLDSGCPDLARRLTVPFEDRCSSLSVNNAALEKESIVQLAYHVMVEKPL
jgi:hypothetical protein